MEYTTKLVRDYVQWNNVHCYYGCRLGFSGDFRITAHHRAVTDPDDRNYSLLVNEHIPAWGFSLAYNDDDWDWFAYPHKRFGLAKGNPKRTGKARKWVRAQIAHNMRERAAIRAIRNAVGR